MQERDVDALGVGVGVGVTSERCSAMLHRLIYNRSHP